MDYSNYYEVLQDEYSKEADPAVPKVIESGGLRTNKSGLELFGRCLEEGYQTWEASGELPLVGYGQITDTITSLIESYPDTPEQFVEWIKTEGEPAKVPELNEQEGLFCLQTNDAGLYLIRDIFNHKLIGNPKTSDFAGLREDEKDFCETLLTRLNEYFDI